MPKKDVRTKGDEQNVLHSPLIAMTSKKNGKKLQKEMKQKPKKDYLD